MVGVVCEIICKSVSQLFLWTDGLLPCVANQ